MCVCFFLFHNPRCIVATEYISGLGPRLRVIAAVPEVVSGLKDVFYGPELTA